MTTQDFDGITHKKPIKSLIVIKKKTSGRNNQGRITTRHKGGGVKQYYRKVNFNMQDGTVGTVKGIEYDLIVQLELRGLKTRMVAITMCLLTLR